MSATLQPWELGTNRDPNRMLPQVGTTAALGSTNTYTGDQQDYLYDPKFKDWAATQGLNMDGISSDHLNANIDSYKNSLGKGDMNWGMQGYGGLALGAGQLALGAMSYFDNQKTADAQRKLLDQKYDNNAYLMNKSKEDSASLKQAFGA